MSMNFQFSGNVEQDWVKALDLWKPYGRVEDLPRNERRPQYIPGETKVLAEKFAATYKNEHEYLVRRLREGNEFENLCAFEILEMMCWEYYIGNVPERLLNLDDVLPPKILAEVRDDIEDDNFSGVKVGEWFSAIFST